MLHFSAFLPLATLLLLPVATHAQTPLSAPARAVNMNAADLKWHRIMLRHTTPSDVLDRMNWKTESLDPFAKNKVPSAPIQATFPKGVEHIFALQSNNSLVVYTTEAGYKTCLEIVAALDTAPRQVQIKTLFAAIPLNSTQPIDLSHPNQLALQLRKDSALFYQPSPTTTDNNTTAPTDNDTTATFLFNCPLRADPHFWDGQSMEGSVVMAPSTLCVIPHINSDGSITFRLNFSKLTPTPNPAFLNQPMTITHTVSNGEMAAYDVTHYFPVNSYRKLLFVTPTAVSQAPDNDSISVIP